MLLASNAFAFSLAGELLPEPTENLFTSPLSVSMVLGMLLNGADRDTYAQIRDVLDRVFDAEQDQVGLQGRGQLRVVVRRGAFQIQRIERRLRPRCGHRVIEAVQLGHLAAAPKRSATSGKGRIVHEVIVQVEGVLRLDFETVVTAIALAGVREQPVSLLNANPILGVFSLLRGTGAAIGPVLGGALVDGFGSRGPALALAATALLLAVLTLRPATPRTPAPPDPDATVG